jgi:hypothetical protein
MQNICSKKIQQINTNAIEQTQTKKQGRNKNWKNLKLEFEKSQNFKLLLPHLHKAKGKG